MPYNRINGTAGNDFLFGTSGDDFIWGDDGDDELRGGDGDDILAGGDGNDIMNGEGGDDLLIGGGGNDIFGWVGGNGEDTLLGGDGNDSFQIFGGSAGGHVVVRGGDGVDRLEVVGDGVVDLRAGTFSTGAATGSVQGVEDVTVFSSQGALVIGNDADNFIDGASNGDDTFAGGGGNDTLIGGPGNDTYVFDAAPGEANADSIVFEKFSMEVHGFEEADRLALDNDVMAALGATGDFAADDERFHAAAGASGGAEADDRVVYDTDSGRLYYDADGSGAGKAQLIATLSVGALQLAADDISVI
jgi:serralysin